MSEKDLDLSNLTEWLATLQKSEAEQSAQASAIIQKHLEKAGLPFKKSGKTNSWFGVGCNLHSSIEQYLQEEKHSEILKAMLAELVDFCEVSMSESFEYKLKILLESFIENESQQSKIIPLLPQKALDQFDKIKQMMREDYENYLERLNQTGY
jgi:hypothetical protein